MRSLQLEPVFKIEVLNALQTRFEPYGGTPWPRIRVKMSLIIYIVGVLMLQLAANV